MNPDSLLMSNEKAMLFVYLPFFFFHCKRDSQFNYLFESTLGELKICAELYLGSFLQFYVE